MLMGMRRSKTLRVTTFLRTSGVSLNPASITQDAASFAAIASGLGTLTLLLTRDDDGLHGFLISEDSNSAFKSAGLLAGAIGAQADESVLPASLGAVEAVGWLDVVRGAAVASESQQGIDPTALVRTLAISMSSGDWVAISFRKPKKNESKRHTRWLSHRFGGVAKPIHHSTGQNAVVCSIFAGADSATNVRDLLNNVAGALPGFDLQVQAKIASRARASVPFLIVGTVATLVALLGWPAVTNVVPAVDFLPAWLLAVPGLATLGLGVARWTGKAQTQWSQLVAACDTGEFPAPPQRSRAPKKPHKERNGDKPKAAFEGGYPLARSTFFVGPHVIVPLVAPHAGAESGAITTSARPVPPVLLQNVGPWIGSSGDAKVHLSAPDLWGGVTIFGQPGSGKSVLTRSLFGWCCLERVSPSGRPEYPGARNTLIAFESKGEGTKHYQAWADATGDVTVQIEMANPVSFAIDLFDVGGTAMERALFFTNAMKYAFEDGDIRAASFDALQRVFTAALAVWPELVARVPGLEADSSPVHLAYVLLSGAGDDMGVALAAVIHAEAIRLQAAGPPVYDPTSQAAVDQYNLEVNRINDLLLADQQLSTLYHSVTPAARRNFTEAPRTKVSSLNKMDSWWSPGRKKVTWKQILDKHRSVIINTGVSAGVVVDPELSGQMSSLLMFSLKSAIERNCDGWQAQNRFVTIFSDELSQLAGSSSDVLMFLRDQGRSYGVRPIFATQRSEKLPLDVRRSVMTMTTFISFSQSDLHTAEEVASSASGQSGEWSASDVLHLERYHAIIRTVVNQVRQSSFTARMENFEANRDGFAALQGYTAATALPATVPVVNLLPQAHVVESGHEQLSLFAEDVPVILLEQATVREPETETAPPTSTVNASVDRPASIVRNEDGTTSVVPASVTR